MTEISSTLTQHTVVVCVEKRERGVILQTFLTKAGFRVVLALTLYDALKFVTQEMPHLVITEALLSDGNAGALYDRLQAHETLKKTPILVHMIKKSKEELASLTGRKFAGFYVGAVEPKAFITKIVEILKIHSLVSPYFVDADRLTLERELMIGIEASVVGRSGEQVVTRSATEVDPQASMLCVPNAADLGPAVFRMASNLKTAEEIFNLFPVHRIVGVGRKWVLGLPEIRVGEAKEAAADKVYKVLFFEPNDERFAGFNEILRGYNIELIHAKTLAAAVAHIKRDTAGIAAVYLHELTGDASGIEWKNTYAKLAPGSKPPLLLGTTAVNARSTSEIRYIKRPFGMGQFVEMLQAAFERPEEVAQVAGKNASNSIAGVPVTFQAQAVLVGLDESGGVLQVKFPLLKGSRIGIQHKFLHAAWEGKTTVQISGTAQVPNKAGVWHVRFESLGAGLSKGKYWEKMTKALTPHLLAAPVQQEAKEQAPAQDVTPQAS